jgi:hypothetical protein
MSEKNCRNILLVISSVVAAIGALVVLGWLSGNSSFQNFSANMPSMKFISASFFFLLGIELYLKVRLFVDGKQNQSTALIIVSSFSLCFAFLCLAIVINPSIGFIVDALPKEETYSVWTRIPYMPALSALFTYLILSLHDLLLFFNFERFMKTTNYIASILMLMGLVAIIGNLVGVPALFFVTKYSGGMAPSSAALFCLVGIYYYGLRYCVTLKTTHS